MFHLSSSFPGHFEGVGGIADLDQLSCMTPVQYYGVTEMSCLKLSEADVSYDCSTVMVCAQANHLYPPWSCSLHLHSYRTAVQPGLF